MVKPVSEACEQNKQDILQIIRPQFSSSKTVLEIGSGTGQHAVYFAQHLPHLQWQTSDRQENLSGIRAWLAESDRENLPPPLVLDVDEQDWGLGQFDGIFSANTTHIMAWPQVIRLFAHVSKHLTHVGRFCLYGPFNSNGFTSDSNESFHHWLQQRDADMGLREISDLQNTAEDCGLFLLEQVEMPVNNKILIWGNKV